MDGLKASEASCFRFKLEIPGLWSLKVSTTHSAGVMTAVHSFYVYLNVVPVNVSAGNRSIKTYVF